MQSRHAFPQIHITIVFHHHASKFKKEFLKKKQYNAVKIHLVYKKLPDFTMSTSHCDMYIFQKE